MIFLQLSQQLQSIHKLLSNLTDEQYIQKVTHLGNSSIGGHTRHVIELLQCALEGYDSGEVDYINRKRNLLLESSRKFAQSALEELLNLVQKPDRQLKLVVEHTEAAVEPTQVNTTYFREVLYNTEHSIHHLALIKVAIIEMKLTMVDDNFGMAYSTIRYQASLNK
ncbi:MAG: DinB family protein [Gloeobacteraceae cyanobacterium ES-bin-316]|nr:DinB family protein [Ferruginibacter sp.]